MSFTILERTQAPALSLGEAKTFLRVTHDQEDDLILRCLQAATEWVENYTGKIIQQKTIAFSIPVQKKMREQAGLNTRLWYSAGRSLFFLPLSPLIAVDRVFSISLQGVPEEVAPHKVHVNQAKDPPFVMIDATAGWGFRLECRMGYEENKPMPTLLKQAILQSMATLYENRGEQDTKICNSMLQAIKSIGV